MAFKQREFIRYQTAQCVPFRLPEFPLQTAVKWLVSVLANTKLTTFTAVFYGFTLIRDEPKEGANKSVI
ncbi:MULTISPECIES: hypothetical protein [unclassified Raoultella]|uniref:hypothetical protein n=1 Tax=unclassified Raoultella TaxID=2627600 RepID=UPI00135AEEAD|nr:MULTISPECIES: hypothetical protein [unclassified Raoultella]